VVVLTVAVTVGVPFWVTPPGGRDICGETFIIGRGLHRTLTGVDHLRVLVTGCAGFIGANTTKRLLDAGHTVAGVDDLNDAYDSRLKDWRLEQLMQHERFLFHRGDIRNKDMVRHVMQECRPEMVYNLAARAGVRPSVESPDIYLETNAFGTLNLLEECRRLDIKRFVLASTSSLYGKHNQVPFREDADTSRPLSPYAASKMAAESMLASFAHLYGMDAPIVRYFTVYGPAGRPDMSVFRFIRWIAEGETLTLYGDGEQSRDFTYVDDIARGTVLVGEKVKGFDVVNLGGDSPHKMNELISLIEGALDKQAEIRREPAHPADVPATWADVSKARSLGWDPQVSLKEGVERTVDWYLEHREWVKGLHLP
jgi:UDP-glucuronate 4-epimerase